MFDEGLFIATIVLDDIRRERIALPLLRDERPELLARELSRVIAERAGMAPDENAESGAGDDLDMAPGSSVPRPIDVGAADGHEPGGRGERTGRAAGERS